MDSFDLFDNIRVEKANALARYRRLNNIAKMLRLIEVFIAVALISWSSTRLPTVFKVSGEYLYACSSYVLNQHVVFLIGNVIVALCYVLSGHTDVRNESSGLKSSEDNNYTTSNNHHKTSDGGRSIVQVVPPPLEESLDMNQTAIEEIPEMVVRCENPPVITTESDVAAETVIKQATKRIEKFQRTQSAKLKRDISMKPRRELRRSMTERRRNPVTIADDDGESATSSVESLSNEEFRLAVEAFILKQQSFLKQQTMVEK